MVAFLFLAVTLGLLGSTVAVAPATPPPIYDIWPRYSPDGKTIAFISNRGGHRGIDVIRTDGTDLAAVTPAASISGTVGSVAWFSNGDLLFTVYEPVFATGDNGSLAAVSFRRMSLSGASERILYQGINTERPASSPSDELLVFEAERGPFESHPVIDVQTFNVATLTTRTLTGGQGENIQAAWSPDGDKIAFACAGRPSDDLQICVMDTDGSHRRTLTFGNGSHEWPAWSPDSKRLAYFIATKTGGVLDCNIALVGVDGGQQILLTHHTAAQRDETPSWSPDGMHLVFQTNRSGNGMRIAIMNADGSNVRALTN